MFDAYKVRPYIQHAIEIKEEHQLKQKAWLQVAEIRVDGNILRFNCNRPVKVGDFVCYRNDYDIYHCPREVFLLRYEEI